MKTIYIVYEKRQYEGYKMRGIFSSLENATAYAKKVSDYYFLHDERDFEETTIVIEDYPIDFEDASFMYFLTNKHNDNDNDNDSNDSNDSNDNNNDN